jgi:predicted nucleic acid-binding protein
VPGLVYVDTNVFVIGFETLGEHSEAVQSFFSVLRNWRGRAITSELTLAELLAPVSRRHSLPQVKRRRLYFDLLLWSDLIELHPVSRDILIETADLRKVDPHKLPDAIHVVTAIQGKCAYFLSDDKGMKRLPHGMRRLGADGPGVAEVLRALNEANEPH